MSRKSDWPQRKNEAPSAEARWWRERWRKVAEAEARYEADHPLTPDESWDQAERLMASAPRWPPPRTPEQLAEIERGRGLWAKLKRKAIDALADR